MSLISQTITLLQGPLELRKGGTGAGAITIDGANHITVNGRGASEVFLEDANVTAILDDLKITGGRSATGGGIDAEGILTLNNSVITGNTVTGYVRQASSTTTLTSSLNPAAFMASVTFTATVNVVSPGSVTPTGNVVFYAGGINLGTAALVAGTGSVQAAITANTLPVGTHSIIAVYEGDLNDLGSASSILNETVT